MSNIHPSAIVEDGAKIAKSAKIGAYSFVSKDAVVGENVELHQGARVVGRTTLGDGVKIFSYAVVGSQPQDLKHKSEDNDKVELIIGENSVIREFVTINPGTVNGGGITRVGSDCLIMAYCHIAHDCQVGNGVVLANSATLAGHVEIGDRTVVGGLTPIHQFVKIGSYCMIGGASAVSQDIPPFCLAESNRAVVRSLNVVGLRRSFDKETINELKEAYRLQFRSDLPLIQTAQEILNRTKNVHVQQMCEFILQTKRGIPQLKNQDQDKGTE